jgi:hypothetical protein
MPFLHDDVFDNGLNVIDANVENLYITNAEISVFANLAAATLGSKAAPTISAPGDRTGGGRKVTVSAITDGAVSANGTASHYALVDDSASKILAAGPLNASQVVTSGNVFTLTAFDVGIPDPS